MNFELLAGLSKSALEGKTSGERAGVDIHDCISATGGVYTLGLSNFGGSGIDVVVEFISSSKFSNSLPL